MYTEADRRIAELAMGQHQVFTREQAVGAGLTRHQVTERLGSGAWQHLARCVYAPAGVAVTTRGRLHGATLVIPGAVASHEAAGELNAFPLVPRGRVVVARPGARPNRSDLAEVRRLVDFSAEDHIVVDGIPTTSPLRTAADLASVLGARRYQQMVDELLVRRDITVEALADYAVRWCRRGRQGSALLWSTVEARGSGYIAPESQLEAKGFAVLAEGGFDEPARQIDLPWRQDLPGRVDCAYVAERVLIEWDSRKHHLIEAQFEIDRRRDADAVAYGWRPLRFTWRMLTKEREWVWSTLAGALRHGRGAQAA
jgi:hypothetical protein